jgi:hypothetical protein
MKKTFIALIIISTMLISIVVVMQVNFGKANPVGGYFPHDPHTIIRVLSPENFTYCFAKSISFEFSLNLSLWYPDYLSKYNPSYSCFVYPIQYFLDGKFAGEILENITEKFRNFSVIIEGLANGTHSLEVNVTTNGVYWHQIGVINGAPSMDLSSAPVLDSSGLIYFSADNLHLPPIISKISLENNSYYSVKIPLRFNVDEPTSQISYSLDNEANVTIDGNTTLAGFAEGLHSLVIYACDTIGNMGKSKTVFFTIVPQPTVPPSPSHLPSPTASVAPSNSPTQQPTPTPTIAPSPIPSFTPSPSPTQQPTSKPTQSAKPTIAPFIEDTNYVPALLLPVLSIVAVAGVLVYFKKRK